MDTNTRTWTSEKKRLSTAMIVCLISSASPVVYADEMPPVPVATLGIPGPGTTVRRMTMTDAIQHAIQVKLTTQLARATTLEAQARVLQDASSLLPQITGTMSQSRIFKTNLAAQGLDNLGAFPPLIGPYNSFDARLQLVQKLLDVNALLKTKAAGAKVSVAQSQETLAEEQVASAAALAYIEDVRALQAVLDAESNFALSQSNATLSHRQEKAGTATSVDSARSDTSEAQNHQSLIQARLDAAQADIKLKRTVGIPLSEALELFSPTLSTGTLPSDEHGHSLPDVGAALSEANGGRLEILIAKQQVDADAYTLNAARSSYVPTITANADYGFSGGTPYGSARTGQIGGRLNVPIFDGGLILGQVKEARAEKTADEEQYADTMAQVEEEVRLALQTLSTNAEGVTTAQTQVQLAERELTLAQNRYSAGVGDNIQVVTAQASVSDARKSLVDSRASYSNALVNLALATGRARHFSF